MEHLNLGFHFVGNHVAREHELLLGCVLTHRIEALLELGAVDLYLKTESTQGHLLKLLLLLN